MPSETYEKEPKTLRERPGEETDDFIVRVYTTPNLRNAGYDKCSELTELGFKVHKKIAEGIVDMVMPVKDIIRQRQERKVAWEKTYRTPKRTALQRDGLTIIDESGDDKVITYDQLVAEITAKVEGNAARVADADQT